MGLRLSWRGEIAGAPRPWRRLLALADERGELWSYVILRLHLCELELSVGDWDAATRLLDEWAESTEAELLVASSYAALPRAARRRSWSPGRGRALGGTGARRRGSDRSPAGICSGRCGHKGPRRCSHTSPAGRSRACA